MTPHGEPLFVLRYRRGHALFRIVVWSLSFLLWLGFALAIPFAAKPGFLGFVLLLCFESLLLFFLFRLFLEVVDLMFIKEVRLYQDRIVKAWKFGGERQIGLAQAKLEKALGAAIAAKRIYHQDTEWF